MSITQTDMLNLTAGNALHKTIIFYPLLSSRLALQFRCLELKLNKSEFKPLTRRFGEIINFVDVVRVVYYTRCLLYFMLLKQYLHIFVRVYSTRML